MTENSGPTFSVVIPSWNRKEELLRAVRSLLGQEFRNWEAIIVDDGSDNQADIVSTIQRLGDDRLHIIASPAHRNAAHARNQGIRQARGDWIAFLDSDDWFTADKLSVVDARIKAETPGPMAIFYSMFRQQGQSQVTQAPQRGIGDGEPIGDYLFLANGKIGTPGIVMSRRFCSELMFDETCIKHQDYDFLLRAEAAGAELVFIDQVLWEREFRQSTDHVGGRYVPAFSCRWLREHEHLLSESAQIAFLYESTFELMVKAGRKRALVDVLKILRDRSLRIHHVGYLLSTLLPYAAYLALRPEKSGARF